MEQRLSSCFKNYRPPFFLQNKTQAYVSITPFEVFILAIVGLVFSILSLG